MSVGEGMAAAGKMRGKHPHHRAHPLVSVACLAVDRGGLTTHAGRRPFGDSGGGTLRRPRQPAKGRMRCRR